MLASETNYAHKHNQLVSQITEPSSEIYARNTDLQSGENFFATRFFLEAVGKWGRQQRERLLESKLNRLGGKNKSVKENAPASNEPINFRERMIMAISGIGHVSLSPLIIIVIFYVDRNNF